MKKIVMLGLATPLILVGCGDDDLYSTSVILEDGALGVQIVDAHGTAINDARISVFDDNNHHLYSVSTNSVGEHSFKLAQGAYTVKVAAQGYYPNPVQGGLAIPVQVNSGEATDTTIELSENPSAVNTSVISGNIQVSNSLVVLSSDTTAYSTMTDSHGNYVLFNVPAGTYDIESFRTGYQAIEKPITVVESTNQSGVDITVNQPASMPSISGMVSFVKTNNSEVDVTVLHSKTKDVIPGAVTYTNNRRYGINNLPNGEFDVWATYNNDGYVVDPQWLIDNGGTEENPFKALQLTIQGQSIEDHNFNITGAVGLISPTNPSDSVNPARVDTTTPTFKWETFSSAHSYAIEVKNSAGERIFDKNIGNVTSYTYDPLDPSAALENGKTYQWNITAFDHGEPLSFSENQMGIIKVELPE